MKPQFIFNQPDAEYRAAKPWLSQTVLKNIINQSPAHARYAMDHPTDSPAMKLGRAAHCLVLEGGEAFKDRYAVAPQCDRRTKEGKATFAEFEAGLNGRDLLIADEAEACYSLAEALSANSLTKDLFIGGAAEVSAFGKIGGIEIKGRFDYYHQNAEVIIDFKTCLDASPGAVQGYAVKYGLHIQQLVYSAIHKSITRKFPADFVFVLAEKSPPFGVAVFRLDRDAVQAAKFEVQRALDIYTECKRSGHWPGYPEAVQSISLPAWYLNKIEAAA